jgi:uncharacterized protein DUF1702
VSTAMGALRKRLLAPPPSTVTFETRRFHSHDPHARQRLEMSALQFILGFEFAIEHRRIDQIVTRLETLEREYRGFAYEGAAMATSIRDALSPRPGAHLTTDFLSGPGAKHIFMAYLGVGFALARLPRMLWRRALPDLSKMPDHTTLVWLVLDGYGFHQAYFQTAKWIGAQHIERGITWDGRRDYVTRALDHGVGRAAWFTVGGDVDRLTSTINGFAEHRHGDLWSGAGLAATYAGGADEESLKLLLKNAGPHGRAVSQGAVFALKARVLADLVTPHHELAAQVFCGCSAADAAAIADRAVYDLHDTADAPAYELFRLRIQDHFR